MASAVEEVRGPAASSSVSFAGAFRSVGPHSPSPPFPCCGSRGRLLGGFPASSGLRASPAFHSPTCSGPRCSPATGASASAGKLPIDVRRSGRRCIPARAVGEWGVSWFVAAGSADRGPSELITFTFVAGPFRARSTSPGTRSFVQY